MISSSKSSSNQSGSQPRLGLITCTALVVSIVAGTGIYTSLGIQLLSISSGFSILFLWVIGGLCALCGALTYAELAAFMPESGGEYYYTSRVYHPAIGTMIGVITTIAGFVTPISLTSMAFGSYLKAVFPGVNPMLASIVLVTIITIMHLVSTTWSALFQDAITGIKFLLIGIIFFVGFYYAKMPVDVLLPWRDSWKELLHPGMGVVLLFCFYAYSGWNSSTYIASEARSEKTISHSLVLGTITVMLLYLLINIIFLLAAPTSELRGVLDVGHVVATHLLGEKGGRILSASIVVGIIAGVSGMTWVGPRITEAMGKDLETLHWLSKTTASGVPLRATLFQYFLVILLLLTSSYKFLLVGNEFALIFSTSVTVLALFVIRYRESQGVPFSLDIDPALITKKPAFRCPLYPLPPIIFLVVSMVAAGYALVTNFKEGLVGIGLILVAIASYPFLTWHLKKSKG